MADLQKKISWEKIYIFTIVLLMSATVVVGSTRPHSAPINSGSDIARRDSVSIIFGGDIEFSRLIKYLYETKNCSYIDSLSRLKPLMKNADYAIVNLETTLRRKGHEIKARPHKLVNIFSDESVLESLTNVGIKTVTLANNHIEDYQGAGINETIKSLNKYGIRYFGLSFGHSKRYDNKNPTILMKNGVKIGILGYCDNENECDTNRTEYQFGPAVFNSSRVIREVKKLRNRYGCHIVILFMHWGEEYTTMMKGANLYAIRDLLRQVKIDLIVGSHPHVTHRHWYVNNTLIATSLGNLYATPYLQANINFNKDVRDTSRDSHFEKIAYRQMKVMQDMSNYGRLLKIEFNKNGIVKDHSKYIDNEIAVTEKHCMVTRKKYNAKWRTICRNDDPECVGTDRCNYLSCDGQDPISTTVYEGSLNPGVYTE